MNLPRTSRIRSMPLRQTPSAVYIQMHQLANERERLQKELAKLADRTLQVQQRLVEVDMSLNQLEAQATAYTLPVESSLTKVKNSQPLQKVTAANKTYNSFVIEY